MPVPTGTVERMSSPQIGASEPPGPETASRLGLNAKFENAERASRLSVEATQSAPASKPGRAADRREVVAGGGDDHDAVGAGVGDRLLQVGDHAGDHERLDAGQRAERQVDHVGAVVDRPADAGGDVLERAAFLVEHLDGLDLRAGRDAGDADVVVGDRGGDAGDVRAVRALARLARGRAGLPVAVAARGRAAVEERGAGHQLAAEVGMAEVDAGVDDADRRAGAGRGRPRLRRAQLLRAPLLGEERVVARQRGGREGEREQDRDERRE